MIWTNVPFAELDATQANQSLFALMEDYEQLMRDQRGSKRTSQIELNGLVFDCHRWRGGPPGELGGRTAKRVQQVEKKSFGG